MTNRKFKTPLFLAASLLLVGCSSDTIVARPTGWGDEKIIVNVGDKDNKMKNIYDAIKALGDTNSNVLNKVIYDISKTTIGKFVKDNDQDTDLTLKDIYSKKDDKDYSHDETFRKFVDTHSKYKADDYSAYLIGTTATVEKLSDDQKYEISLKKIVNQYEEIVENIYEKLFEDIKGGSYSTQTQKLFDEELYYQHLKKELYIDVTKKPTKFLSGKAFLTKTKDISWKKYVNVTYDKTSETFTGGYLQVVDADNVSTGIYDDYINRKILPELYKTYLTETYVKEQRYSSLGRSYARKVNMITVPNGGQSYSGNVLKMFNYFAKTFITGDKTTLGTLEVSYDFENITKAMIGFVGAPDISASTSEESKASIEYKLLNYTISNTTDGTDWNNRRNFTPIKIGDENLRWPCYTDENGKPTSIDSTTGMPTGSTTYVYYGTKLGDLVEKYMKIYDLTIKSETQLDQPNFTITPRSNPDETAYNDITNNGAYSVATGLAVKEKDLRLNDMTKDGWFLKNGGLTDLDSTFRDRLFNISTSNTIDNKDKKESLTYKSGEYVRYFGNKGDPDLSKRKAFLVDSTKGEDNPWESIVLIGDSNYYIVEVEEATNTSKLSNANNAGSYYRNKTEADSVTTADTVDKLTREVIKANSTSDTYKKNANEYYLMISNIVFYDQSVYDYFKSQFPDLFK